MNGILGLTILGAFLGGSALGGAWLRGPAKRRLERWFEGGGDDPLRGRVKRLRENRVTASQRPEAALVRDLLRGGK